MLSLSVSSWLAAMRQDWQQGEHIVILGQTGRGKTSIARELMGLRDYVVVFGFKQQDETLREFTRHGYEQIRTWPPEYYQDHVILWLKPGDLNGLNEQRGKAFTALNAIFRDGGWAILLDDTGYVTSMLRLTTAVAMLLSQGRSSGISMVTVMTQPSSLVQRIPSETVRQVRHYIIFKYHSPAEIRRIRDITGHELDMSLLQQYRSGARRWSDFYAISHDEITLVRNTQRS